MERIRWTDAEKAAVKRRFDEIRREAPHGFLIAANMAQEVLPEQRRRKIGARQAVPWLDGRADRKVTKLIRAQEEADRKKREAQEEAERREREECEAAERAEQERLAREEAIRVQARAELRAALTIGDHITGLVDLISRDVAERVVKLLAATVVQEPPAVKASEEAKVEPAPPPPPPPQRRKPRVLVIGIKPHHADVLIHTYPEFVITGYLGGHGLRKTTFPSADHVFLIEPWIPVDVRGRLERLYAGKLMCEQSTVGVDKALERLKASA